LDIVKQFAGDKRVTRFNEDLSLSFDVNADTLLEAYHLQDASRELNEFIAILSKKSGEWLRVANNIIDRHYKAGEFEEGNLKIEAKTKSEDGTLDVESFKKEHQSKWDFLIKEKHDDLDKKFKPTLTEVRALLKKDAEQFIIPGKEKVIGLKLVLVSPPGEKTSIEVEP
jgi:hypothetical protein